MTAGPGAWGVLMSPLAVGSSFALRGSKRPLDPVAPVTSSEYHAELALAVIGKEKAAFPPRPQRAIYQDSGAPHAPFRTTEITQTMLPSSEEGVSFGSVTRSIHLA